MSIPIAATEHIQWVDEKTSVKYLFRYLTGEMTGKFLKLQVYLGDPSAFIAQAARDVDKKHPGKRWKKGEKDKAIQAYASELSSAAGSEQDMMAYACGLIDLFLIGWESDKVKLPPFPDKPSQMMKQDLILKLSEAITERIDDLSGFDADEGKN